MKKFFAVLLAIVLGFFILTVFILPQIVSQSEIQKYLKEKIREKAGDSFEFDKIGVGFFPSVSVEARGIKVYLPADPKNPNPPARKPLFEARKAKLILKIIPLFFKQFEAKGIELQGAQFSYDIPGRGPIQLTEINGSMRGLSSNVPSKFKLKGLVYGRRGTSFTADGTVRMDMEKLNMKLLDFNGHFDIRNILLEHLIEAELIGKDTPLSSAQLDAKGSFDLIPESKNISGNAEISVSDIAIKEGGEARKIPGTASVKGEFQYLLQSRVFELRDSKFSLPGIDGAGSGTVNFLAEPQLDLSFRMKQINFNEIKKIFPEKFTGINLSGLGSGAIILKGTSAKILVNLESDLSQVEMEIPQKANKPAGHLLTLSAQTYVAGSRASEGEFNLHFGEMVVKGAVEKLDLKSGVGEINFITNKFPLSEWNGLVTAFSTLKASGSAKIASNIKGNFLEPGSLGYSTHLTLDQAVLHQDGKVFIQGLSGAFDFEPEKFGIQESRLLFGGSDLDVSLDLRDFHSPFFQARVGSTNLTAEDLTALIERLKEFKMPNMQANAPASAQKPVQTSWFIKEAYAQVAQPVQLPLPAIAYRAKGTVDFNLKKVSWSGRQLENLSGRAAWNQGDLALTETRGAMGGGRVLAAANMTWKTNPPAYAAKLETQAIPIEMLTEKDFVAGSLFSTTDVRGYLGNSELVQNSVTGQGAFQVTNGEIRGFSLMSSLSSALPSLVGLKGGKMGGTTEFESLDGQFRLGERKADFPTITLQSKTINASAQGVIGFDRTIYFKGIVEVTGSLGGILGNSADSANPLRFPLEVGGTLDHPKLSVQSQAAIGTTVAKDVLGQFLGKKKKAPSSGNSTADTASTAAELLSSFLGK